MFRVDLNCDLGESFGAYMMGMDDKVIPFITSANVACGYHASDPVVMERTVGLCKTHNVAIGAHPGFPDLMGFGRREMRITEPEAKAYMLYQIGALDGFCRATGLKLAHVKPHGALYNMAARDATLARAICQAVREYDKTLVLLALAGSEMVRAAQEMDLPVAQEVFADRGYEEDGSLVSRQKPGAMITDEEEAIARVVRIVQEGKVTAVTGRDIPVRADSICIHGDGEHALAFAKKIREALISSGIRLMPLQKLAE